MGGGKKNNLKKLLNTYFRNNIKNIFIIKTIKKTPLLKNENIMRKIIGNYIK